MAIDWLAALMSRIERMPWSSFHRMLEMPAAAACGGWGGVSNARLVRREREGGARWSGGRTLEERPLERKVLDDREGPEELGQQARPAVGELHRALADVELHAHDVRLDGREKDKEGDADEGRGPDLEDQQDRRCGWGPGASV